MFTQQPRFDHERLEVFHDPVTARRVPSRSIRPRSDRRWAGCACAATIAELAQALYRMELEVGDKRTREAEEVAQLISGEATPSGLSELIVHEPWFAAVVVTASTGSRPGTPRRSTCC